MDRPRARTAWHPLLVALLRKLTPSDAFEVIGEYSLTREPLRLDVVVLRKLRDARPFFPLLPSFFTDLAPHTLVSFKGPTDEVDRDDAAMLLVYASLYLVIAQVPHPREIALRLIVPEITPRFRERLYELGGHIRYDAAGLSTGNLGVFPLRIIETERAFSYEEEHLWYAFAPSLLRHQRPPHMAQEELTFYQYLYQQVEQFRLKGDPLMYKDLDLAKMSLEEAMASLMADMPSELRLSGLPPEILLAGISAEQRLAGLAPEQRLAGLDPEQRLAGLDPEQRLAGLDPEQRLAGLGTEQRLAGLDPEQVGAALGRDNALLALPDEVLRLLPDEVLNAMRPEAREKVRQRIGR